jgi:hypothetical protein
MIYHVKSREPAGDQREVTGLPSLAAVSRPFEGLAPRSVRLKSLFRTAPGASDLYRYSPGMAELAGYQTADG